MSRLRERLCALFGRPADRSRANAEDQRVRELFKTRYWNFKQLLELNQRSMDLIAGMEHHLKAGQSFGMSFIRAQATSLSVCVYQIVQKLDQLAPGRYPGLTVAFNQIQERINAELADHDHTQDGPLIMDLKDVRRDDADLVGSKMATLGELAGRLGLPIPDGFVVCSSAYDVLMGQNRLREWITQQLQSAPMDDLETLYEVSRDIQQTILSRSLPEDLSNALDMALAGLQCDHGPGLLLAVRSSALGEDGPHLSFAGQYKTELNVPLSDVPEAVKRVIAAKYSARAIAYRHNHGLRDEDIRMCVGCMSMVRAQASGVVYSRDPGHPRAERVFINAAPGLGHQVVDGSVSPRAYVLGRGEEGWRELEASAQPEPAPPTEAAPGPELLTSEQVDRLATLSRELEQAFGTAQDVEWALDQDNVIVVLQSRPLRTMKARPAALDQFGEDDDLPEPLLKAGVCAASGVASGPVRLLRSREDAAEVRPGDVLFVEHALPHWAVVLEKAAAVVADRGGMASHLATVAREYNIPALFNTLQATRIIPPGHTVTVDADTHRIYPGRVDSLLDRHGTAKPSLMQDSPVLSALKNVLRQITPLNLLHPGTPEFCPEACRSYHDIIRFCHEQAVREMFTLGLDSGFHGQAGKQLQTTIPMQWWIVDLVEEPHTAEDDRTIQLRDIRSRPFQAIWEGIVAVPWQGPPTPDMRGFFSVMANSAMNSDLDVCAHSVMQQQNCAFVSPKFCSLNCRFGYHFSVIQAFVGERGRENYIRFSFQGGAADETRKRRRLDLIRTVLEEAGFFLEIREDTLNARLEGYDETFLLQRLKVLGFLIIHTRQIDMVMSDSGKTQGCLNMLLTNVREMIGTNPPGSGQEGATQ